MEQIPAHEMTCLYALASNQTNDKGETIYRIATLQKWKDSLDWIVFEVFWEQYSFKKVELRDGKYCFVR